MFDAMIFVMGGGAAVHIIYANFPGDKYKLLLKKLMQIVLGLVVSKWHGRPWY